MSDEFIHEPRIAYFSMEIALESEIPTYAGGLGILAGDTVRSAADLGLPLVAVTLVSRDGYFSQQIDAQGRQVERPAPWDPSRFATLLDAKVAVPIEGHVVWVGGWLYVLQSHLGGRQPVVLLDTDFPENAPDDRDITHQLYGGDDAYRLKQEIVLGIGGVRLLRALGIHAASVPHERRPFGAARSRAAAAIRLSVGGSAARRIPLRRSARARAVPFHDAYAGRSGARPLRL